MATLIDETLKDNKSDKGRPPKVKFQWGTSFQFDAYITHLTQKYTMFLPDGTPVRATLSLEMVQAMDDHELAKQNPSSGGDGGERLYTVQQGESLSLIAHRMMGSTNAWRSIATANNLSNVRKLTPGTILVIPND